MCITENCVLFSTCSWKYCVNYRSCYLNLITVFGVMNPHSIILPENQYYLCIRQSVLLIELSTFLDPRFPGMAPPTWTAEKLSQLYLWYMFKMWLIIPALSYSVIATINEFECTVKYEFSTFSDPLRMLFREKVCVTSIYYVVF